MYASYSCIHVCIHHVPLHMSAPTSRRSGRTWPPSLNRPSHSSRPAVGALVFLSLVPQHTSPLSSTVCEPIS